MAITDLWGNTLNGTTGSVLGYRSSVDEFPHDLYSYILSTIRNADQDHVALLYRFMVPMQEFWESQYGTIFGLSDLLSPEDCPAKYLEYLRWIVGLLDDMSYLWSVLTENEKRIMIKYFVRFLQYRGTDYGVLDMLDKVTGAVVVVQNFFFYRWLLSGNGEFNMETALGREDEGFDPWLISEDAVPTGMQPDVVTTPTNPLTSKQYYHFDIDALVAAVTNPPIPDKVLVRYLPTGESAIGTVHYDGSDYTVQFADEYFFGQSVLSLSTLRASFRVGFEPDPYVYDILIMDTGDLNRAAVRSMAKFSRPLSERIWIRYYQLLEEFKHDEWWDVLSGTVTFDTENENVELSDAISTSSMSLNIDGSDAWDDYELSIKFQFQVAQYWADIAFMYQDTNNNYILRIEPNTVPSAIAGTWILYTVIAGVPTIVDSGNLEQLDLDVNYFWRITCRTSNRPGGDVQIIQIWQDENLITTYVDDPISWSSPHGTIYIGCEANGQIVIDKVLVRDLNDSDDYVGP